MQTLLALTAILIRYPSSASVVDLPLNVVSVAEPVIVGKLLSNPSAPVGEESVREELRRESQTWTIRALRVNKVAKEVIPSSIKRVEAYELKTEYRIPISLPPDSLGLIGANRRGQFMSAKFVLINPTGRTILTKDVSLVWGDGDWIKGVRQTAKNRPMMEVLKSFVRKASDRAIQQMKRELANK